MLSNKMMTLSRTVGQRTVLATHKRVSRSELQCLHLRFASTRTVMEVKDLVGRKVDDDLATKTAVVRGWVKSVRKQKKFSFVEVSDGSCMKNVQVVVDSDKLPSSLATGTSVSVSGELVPARHGGYEISGQTIDIIGECSSTTYPLQKKYHSPEFLREVLHLRPRTNRIGEILRIRSTLNFGVHKFFNDNGFMMVNTPILTSIDCEGAGEMFEVSDPFRHDAQQQEKEKQEQVKYYLTVSGQLHAEVFASAFSKVYTFGPTFRAENSNTTRHLTEFWMLEPEVAFHSLEDSMNLAQACIKSLIKEVMEHHDIENLFKTFKTKGQDQIVFEQEKALNDQKMQDIIIAKEKPFAILTYDECIDILQRSGQQFEFPVVWEHGLQSEHERYLCENYCDRTPVFVTHYPKQCKAFYMKESERNDELVNCFDLLVPRIGELIGGSQREDDLEKLLPRLKGNQAEELKWYLELREYGSVPHSGWGMGFERFIQFISGADNIRDTIPIPRTPGSVPL